MENTMLQDVKEKLLADQKLVAVEERPNLLEPELTLMPKNAVIGHLEGQMKLRQDLMDASGPEDRIKVFEKSLQ